MERQLRGLLLMLLFSIVGYQTSQGQVKIQESVSINASSVLSNAKEVSYSPTMTLKAWYTGFNGFDAFPAVRTVDGVVSNDHWDGSPFIVTTEAVFENRFITSFRFWGGTETNGCLYWEWLYGDYLVGIDSAVLPCYLSYILEEPFYQMVEGIRLLSLREMTHGDVPVQLGVRDVPGTVCVSPGWDNLFGIRLEVIEGAKYGEFKSNDTTSLGTTLICLRSDIDNGNVYYAPNGEDPDSDKAPVSIRMTSAAIDDTIHFVVNRLEHLSSITLACYQDTLKYGDSYPLSVMAYDQFGNEYPLADTSRFQLDLYSGAGVFRNADDTVVTSATYGELHAGTVRYTAEQTDAVTSPVMDVFANVGYAENTNISAYQYFHICLSEPVLVVSKTFIHPGDTIDVNVLQHRYSDCSEIPYPGSQEFTVSLLDSSSVYGFLQSIASGKQGSTIESDRGPFLFIADSTWDDTEDGSDLIVINAALSEPDVLSCSVRDSIVAVLESAKSSAQKIRLMKSLAIMADTAKNKNLAKEIVSGLSLYQRKTALKSSVMSVGAANTAKKNNVCTTTKATMIDTVYTSDPDVLLGQSKYFFVKKIGDSWQIVNVKSPPTANPGESSAVFDNPVAASGSAKNPVYWETKYPVYNGNTFVGMNDLPKGMIRVIGRYWEEGMHYKALLSATYNGQPLSVTSEVLKPRRLFNPNIGKYAFKTTSDIFDNYLDIDSLCITYAGIIGISPQIIKSQMFQESDKTNNQFNPSYRYEPFKDYDFAHNGPEENIKSYKSQPFWITYQSPMGYGEAIPTTHQNVHPIPYPTPPPISQEAFVLNNWSKYWNSKNNSVVGSKKLTSRWYSYFLFYSLIEYVYSGITPIDYYQNALDKLKDYIRETYTDLAQTRKCASYGFIQMLYTTAQTQGYNKGNTVSTSQAPENLNNQNIEMKLYQTFITNNLDKTLNKLSAKHTSFEWPLGWEKTWMKSFKPYNSDPNYATSVISNANLFYPQSK